MQGFGPFTLQAAALPQSSRSAKMRYLFFKREVEQYSITGLSDHHKSLVHSFPSLLQRKPFTVSPLFSNVIHI
jgi:hypothetical protein